MNFNLQFSIPPFPEKINYDHAALFMGSCFAEEIGGLMQAYKFNALINPHGILYNPSGIASALRKYISNKPVAESELFFANECWNSWQHHSRFSDPDKQKCLSVMNDRIASAHVLLKKAEWLFITFGSAYTYTRNGSPVANCHKQPQKEFLKQLESTSGIVEEYSNLFDELKRLNPELKIVLTVSPVRYIRDGVVENNLSKARLIDAVHQLSNEQVFYFPAYELIIDVLRDHRFYKEDLVHPTGQAIRYVFEKFMAAAFDERTNAFYEKIKELILAKEHRPFNEDTESYKRFKRRLTDRCLELKKQYPLIDLEDEQRFFS